MKKLPLGIQNFREIIEDGHVYVDKTMFIHRLITGGKSYFLAAFAFLGRGSIEMRTSIADGINLLNG